MCLGDPVEPSQSMLGITSKRFNLVGVVRTSDEFIVAVIHPEMSINADVHKPIVAAPSISVWITRLGVTLKLAAGLCRYRG